jgi:hypothetical protein
MGRKPTSGRELAIEDTATDSGCRTPGVVDDSWVDRDGADMPVVCEFACKFWVFWGCAKDVDLGLGVWEAVEGTRCGFPDEGVLVAACPRAGELCKLPAGCREDGISRECRLVTGPCWFNVDVVLESGIWEDDCGGTLVDSDHDRWDLKLEPLDI